MVLAATPRTPKAATVDAATIITPNASDWEKQSRRRRRHRGEQPVAEVARDQPLLLDAESERAAHPLVEVVAPTVRVLLVGADDDVLSATAALAPAST